MNCRMGWIDSERREFPAGQFFKGLNVFLRGLFGHADWQFRRGWSFIPVEGFEVVADKVLVEAWGIGACDPGVRWPETGRVGREALVDEDHAIISNAEFKLRVCN